jgi:hypothetical protein
MHQKNSETETKKLYDDCFYVEQKKWGTWDSYDKNGKCIITSLTEEECVRSTRYYLKGLQEGWGADIITYEGTVGGKL